MENGSLEQQIIEIAGRLTGKPDIRPDMDLMDDIGLSSMGLMELIGSLEEELDIAIKAPELRRIFTLGDLIGLAEEKRNRK